MDEAERNLYTASRMDRRAGWSKAKLLAASVERGKGGPRTATPGVAVKVTVREAAEITWQAGFTTDCIRGAGVAQPKR